MWHLSWVSDLLVDDPEGFEPDMSRCCVSLLGHQQPLGPTRVVEEVAIYPLDVFRAIRVTVCNVEEEIERKDTTH